MLLLVMAGCLKPTPIPRAATETPVAVVAVLESLDTDAVEAWPQAAEAAVTGALAARNLPPTVLDDSVFADWTTVRSSPQRLAQLPAAAGGAELMLMLETQAEFYSQLSGQFRWTVEVRASLAPVGDLDAAMVESFSVPVFLFNYNEQEHEALEAAAPSIERQVGALVDQFLGL